MTHRSGSQRGFTLIEMLVSLSIFAVVTAFVMADFRSGQQSDELRYAGQLVASGIRRAQTSAIAGQTVNWCDGGGRDKMTCPSGADAACEGGTCRRDVPQGFGLHLSRRPGAGSTMTMFADIDGDKRYDEGESIRVDSVSPGRSVRVQGLSPEDVGELDIVFVPPRPTTLFNAGTPRVTAAVGLIHEQTERTITVTVNAVSGQINVQ